MPSQTNVKWYRVLIVRELTSPDGSTYLTDARIVLCTRDFKDAEKIWSSLLNGSQYQAIIFLEMPDGKVYEDMVFDGDVRQKPEMADRQKVEESEVEEAVA